MFKIDLKKKSRHDIINKCITSRKSYELQKDGDDGIFFETPLKKQMKKKNKEDQQ